MPSSTASCPHRTASPSTARPCANHQKNPPSVASLTPTTPSEPLKPSMGAAVRDHRNAVRDRSESCPQSIGTPVRNRRNPHASKYGAFSTDRGRADIGWGTEGDTFTMSWIERDGPSVSAPKRRGFGTIVVEAMAERSVDGTVDLHYPPSGLTWRLTCPAANALEHREPAQISGRKRKSN